MTVSPGFKGMAKIGDWLPVNVSLANDGPSVTGQLQIEINDNAAPGNRVRNFSGRPPTTYTIDATLPSHSRKQYQIDIFLPNIADAITARLVTDQGVLVEQTGKMQALSGSDVLCGTLSRNQDFYQSLTTLDLPGRTGKKPFVAALTLADIPSSQHALSSLDCLILNNVSMTGLNDDQKSALLGWVEDGGLLVLGGGNGWQKTLQPLPKELLPVNVTGLKTVPTLQPLADFAQQPIKGDGPWPVVAGTAVNSTVVLQQNGVPLLVGARRGKGDVIFLAVDPTAEPLNTWNGNAALWKYIMAYNSTPLASYASFNAFGGFNTIQNWGVPPRSAIYNIAGVDPPSNRWLLLLTLMFGLVAGPINYVVLRVVDRRELGWLTIPVCIAAASFMSFRIAQQYTGSDLILNKISVVRSDGNSSVANVRTYVSLYTPRKGDFQVSLPGTAAVTSYASPGLPAVAQRQAGTVATNWKLKVTEGDSTTRIDLPLEEANTGTFFSDSQVQLKGKFDSSLKVQGQTISGSVTNHTGESVEDVLLSLGQDVAKLGLMHNGETKSVNFTFDASAPSSAPSPLTIRGALDTRGQAETTMLNRQGVLDAFLGSNSSAQPAGLSGLTLLGWLENSPLPVDVSGANPSLKETNLYVSPLPLSFTRGQDFVIPPALIETSQIGTFSTTFQRTGQYELNPGGSVALQYALPVAAADMTDNKLVLQMNGHYAGAVRGQAPGTPGASLGQIFIYNWQSANWDAQDFSWGNNLVDTPAQYISATSVVRIRFTYKAPPRQPTDSIQFSLDLTDQGQLK